MEPRHAPIVTIDGTVIDPGWSRVSPTILDAITIDWGASSLYDEVPPAALKLQMVFPTGGTLLVKYFQDREVRISTDLGLLYRGMIASTSWDELYVWDEETRENVRYWLVTVMAYDPVAAVSAFVPRALNTKSSSSTNPPLWSAWNRYMAQSGQYPFFGRSNDWNASRAAMRYTVPEQIVEAGFVTTCSNAAGAYPNKGFRTHLDRADAWQLLREVYGTRPLAEAAFDPRTDSIGPTFPTTEPVETRLTYAASKLQLGLIPGTGARMISADHLILPDGFVRAETDRVLNISTVEYQIITATHQIETYPDPTPPAGPRPFSAQRMGNEKETRAVPGARPGGSNYSRPIFMVMGYGTADADFNKDPVNRTDQNELKTIDQHLTETVNLVAKLNGCPAVPDLIFDWERSAASVPVATEQTLLAVTPIAFHSRPLVITSAPMLSELGIDNYAQVIGGRLTYEQGWKHRLRFAPVAYATASTLTLAGIVTNATATYNSYDDGVTYQDLSLINLGAA